MTGTAAQQAERLALLVLSAASGAVDTFTFLCLGKVFAGVMTGNLVLIGVSVATSDGTQAIRALAALAYYCAGVATAALIADRLPRRTVLAGEAVLLTLSATCWALATDRSGTLLWALLVTNALAMGLQARTWGTPTTYFTGTLTGLAGQFGLGTEERWAAGRLAAVVAGALLVAALLRWHTSAAGLAPVALVILAMAVARGPTDGAT
ncbi:YoaK family protein [Kitasatospora gansuensis]